MFPEQAPVMLYAGTFHIGTSHDSRDFMVNQGDVKEIHDKDMGKGLDQSLRVFCEKAEMLPKAFNEYFADLFPRHAAQGVRPSNFHRESIK
jgi:hypothetical protein